MKFVSKRVAAASLKLPFSRHDMNALAEIKSRFSTVLLELVDDPTELLSMIRPAGDPKFGDYQANCAMPMGKQMGKSPREIAADLVNRVSIDDFC